MHSSIEQHYPYLMNRGFLVYIFALASYIYHTTNPTPISIFHHSKMKNLVTVSNTVTESDYGKITLSDVMVTRKRNLFWGRKWRTVDIQIGLWILSLHLLALFAPFTFTWGAFCLAFSIWVLCGVFGVTLCYHRHLAHRSFNLPKWLEYMFAYLGVLSGQVRFYNLFRHVLFSYSNGDHKVYLYL